MRLTIPTVWFVSAVFFLSGCNSKNSENKASLPAAASRQTIADPRPAPNPLRNAYFGDLHLHTSYSMDAFAFGTRTTPEDSYRYAMGEPVEYFGKQWKRLAPLDFLAVTDHAEYLGTVRESINPNGPFAKSEWYTAMTSSDPKVSGQAFQKLLGSTMANTPIPEFNNPDLRAAAWESYAAIPDRYYKPGKFTSFVGFEWTSMPQAQNLHRCVIFADKGPALPYTAFQSIDPEDLWRYLEASASSAST